MLKWESGCWGIISLAFRNWEEGEDGSCSSLIFDEFDVAFTPRFN